METRDALRSMINNLINDKRAAAGTDLHNYLTTKMRDVAGIAVVPPASPTIDAEAADDDAAQE